MKINDKVIHKHKFKGYGKIIDIDNDEIKIRWKNGIEE